MYSTKISLAANQSCSPMKKKMKEPLVGSLLAFFVIFVLNKREPFKRSPSTIFQSWGFFYCDGDDNGVTFIEKEKGCWALSILTEWRHTQSKTHCNTHHHYVAFTFTLKDNERTTGTRFQSLPLLWLEYKNKKNAKSIQWQTQAKKIK